MKKLALLLFPILVVLVALTVMRPEALEKSPAQAVTSKLPPIILVHGFNHNSDFWDDIHLTDALAAKNYVLMGEFYADESKQIQIRDITKIKEGQSACYKLSLPKNGTQDICESGVLLEKAIHRISLRHEVDKVRLVSFSAGGVVCRDYLTHHINDHKVESLTTVSAPHLGSEHAWLADGFHGMKTRVAKMAADTTGNAFMRGSRHYSVKALSAITGQIEKLGNKSGIDINSKAARMLACPENGNYLDKLSHADYPKDVKYHCIITEENLLSYDLGAVKEDFIKIKNGDFSQTDFVTTMVDLGRFGLGKLDKFSEQFSQMKFRGDGVVSKFSQDLNNIEAFKANPALYAMTTHLETQHGGPEIKDAILIVLDLKE